MIHLDSFLFFSRICLLKKKNYPFEKVNERFLGQKFVQKIKKKKEKNWNLIKNLDVSSSFQMKQIINSAFSARFIELEINFLLYIKNSMIIINYYFQRNVMFRRKLFFIKKYF